MSPAEVLSALYLVLVMGALLIIAAMLKIEALRIVAIAFLVLVAVLLGSFVFSKAYGQAVGRVGSVGALMSPNAGAGGLPPISPFAIVTESGQQLDTEAGQYLETEGAP